MKKAIVLVCLYLTSCFPSDQLAIDHRNKIVSGRLDRVKLIKIDEYYDNYRDKNRYVLLWQTSDGILIQTTNYDVNPYPFLNMTIPTLLTN